jgi:nickel-dependent lactate racemase
LYNVSQRRRKMSTIEVPTLLWHGTKNIALDFPSTWSVTKYEMRGAHLPSMTTEALQAALQQPIHSLQLGKLARERSEVAIVIDDMTRPTRPYLVLPYILRELQANGISRDHIRFIIGLGAHGTIYRRDYVKKLGEDVVDEYAVWNHNVFGNHEYLGETALGTPVEINAEFMACDLKIAIGGIVPHPLTGFGGGAKIITPGISSLKTINHNHIDVGLSGPKGTPHHTIGWGKNKNNIMMQDNEEIAMHAGLDIKIDMVFNAAAQPAGLFAGEVTAEFREGVEMAKSVYATENPSDVDIVVANNYFKSNEASLALGIAGETVREGGTIVLITFNPEGQVPHYSVGKWGKAVGGALFNQRQRIGMKPRYGNLIIYSPHKQRDPTLPIGDPESQKWVKTWKEVIEELQNLHPSNPTVAVFPTAEVQRPPWHAN